MSDFKEGNSDGSPFFCFLLLVSGIIPFFGVFLLTCASLLIDFKSSHASCCLPSFMRCSKWGSKQTSLTCAVIFENLASFSTLFGESNLG